MWIIGAKIVYNKDLALLMIRQEICKKLHYDDAILKAVAGTFNLSSFQNYISCYELKVTRYISSESVKIFKGKAI